MAYKLPKDEVWQCMNCKWVPANPRKWVKKCKRCDNVNHAPIGSGEYRPWCIISPGHYKKIENWTQPCDEWEATK